MCQYVLQHEHGVLLAVSVGLLQLSEHGSDLLCVVRDVHLCLIGLQNRILSAPCFSPVGFVLVFFRGITDDLLDARLVVVTIVSGD